MRRRLRRIGVGLGIVFAALAALLLLVRLWPAPGDPGRTRPETAHQTPFAQRDVRVADLRLRYVDEGPHEGTPLVIIPGHTSRVEEYDALVTRLSPRRRVLVLDFPGSGYSEKPVRDYTLGFYEETLLGFLDAMGLERVHLAGGSLGGNLTLRLGAHHPERFERLVPWSPGSAWQRSPAIADLTKLVTSYALFWPTVRVQSKFWYSDDFGGQETKLADTFTYYREVLSPGFVRMYWGIAADSVATSLFDVAADVQSPTLLLCGDRDRTPGMVEGCRRIKALLPRGELQIYAGAPHALATELPDRLGAALEEFLDRPDAKLP